MNTIMITVSLTVGLITGIALYAIAYKLHPLKAFHAKVKMLALRLSNTKLGLFISRKVLRKNKAKKTSESFKAQYDLNDVPDFIRETMTDYNAPYDDPLRILMPDYELTEDDRKIISEYKNASKHEQ